MEGAGNSVSSSSKRLTDRPRFGLMETEINVPDAISVICNIRQERFPFERLLALLTFNVWLRFPDCPEVVTHARFVGAATILKAVAHGELKIKQSIDAQHKLFSAVFTPEAVLFFAEPSSFLGSFHENFSVHLEENFGACAMLDFLVRCPASPRPSVNKAISFVEEDRAYFRTYIVDGIKKPVPFKRTEIKKSWTRFAITAPFVFVAHIFEHEHIINLAADSPGDILHGNKLLRNKTKLHEYFGLVRATQDLIRGRIIESSVSKKFVQIPTSIDEYPVTYTPLDDHTLPLLAKHKSESRSHKSRPSREIAD